MALKGEINRVYGKCNCHSIFLLLFSQLETEHYGDSKSKRIHIEETFNLPSMISFHCDVTDIIGNNEHSADIIVHLLTLNCNVGFIRK